ncbi:MAG: NAD(P)H-dependent flavin oxidoreductase [Acidithiobacillus sp.]
MASKLPTLKIKGRSLLPIIQGGMGVGVSAHRLAGTVAAQGGVGTIASVELRRLHEDLMRPLRRLRDPDATARANLVALDREVQEARRIAGKDGFIAVNVMRAITHYREHVLQALKSGADAIIVGAGLPLDLPELAVDYPRAALIPILSELRGVQAVVRRWMRRGRLPDAIVIEHPRYAGGHVGATHMEEINDPRFDFATVLPAIRDFLYSLGDATARIPIIPAGGINSFQRIKDLLAMGASGVQIGTPFAVTKEGDAHDNFKRVLAEAEPADIVTFMSAAGLPARAVMSPWLRRYLSHEEELMAHANPQCARCPSRTECLTHCGFKDGNPAAGQFCIETQLAAAQRGNVQQGLFFRGAASLPFGKQIRSVQDLLRFLQGENPAMDAHA